LCNRLGGTVQGDLALVALQTFFLADLQKERAVAEGKTAIHTFSAADTKVMVNDVFKIGRFNFPAGKRVGRTQLVFRPFISCKGLRIEKAGTKVTISAHGKVVKTLDRRNRFITSVRTYSATNTFFGINLPNGRASTDSIFCTKKTHGTGNAGSNTEAATRFQQGAAGSFRFHWFQLVKIFRQYNLFRSRWQGRGDTTGKCLVFVQSKKGTWRPTITFYG
jgi:hypothetical protein